MIFDQGEGKFMVTVNIPLSAFSEFNKSNRYNFPETINAVKSYFVNETRSTGSNQYIDATLLNLQTMDPYILVT